jgi:hypothetical protein
MKGMVLAVRAPERAWTMQGKADMRTRMLMGQAAMRKKGKGRATPVQLLRARKRTRKRCTMMLRRLQKRKGHIETLGGLHATRRGVLRKFNSSV